MGDLQRTLSVLLAALMWATPRVGAGDNFEPLPTDAQDRLSRDWSLELGSGLLFANIRDDRLESQTLIPIEFTLGYAVDEVSLDDFAGGFFRGYTEVTLRAFGDIIEDGVQSRFIGASFGPRYNFVQPGWTVVPFVEGTVGLGFADSDPQGESYDQVGLGQDFNFMFTSGAGLRWDISPDWYLRVWGEFKHISNGGLSEPERKNKPIDAFGPKMSVGTRF